MNEARARQLIDAYGADPARWPDDERVAAEALCEALSDLATYRADAARMDQRLDDASVMATLTPEGVLAALAPELIVGTAPPTTDGALERLLNWLFPSEKTALWRPAIVACAPLVAGVALGIGLGDDPSADLSSMEQQLFAYSAEDYRWEEMP
jgi:hypothetical protein